MDRKTGAESESLEERRMEVVVGTQVLPPCMSCLATDYKWVLGVRCSNCYADKGREVNQDEIRAKEDAEIDAELQRIERSVHAEQEALEETIIQRSRRLGLPSKLAEAEPLPDLATIQSPSGAMPLSDLQIRLRLLKDAGAKYYKDGMIEIHLEGRPQKPTSGTF